MYLKEKYIRDVYDTILIRDLVEKYRLGRSTVLKKVSEYLMDNVSNTPSSRNISHALVAAGTETNYKTIGSYVEHLCHAFVFYEARRYDVRRKFYLQSLSIYYLADTGIRFAVLGKRKMDWGLCLRTLFI